MDVCVSASVGCCSSCGASYWPSDPVHLVIRRFCGSATSTVRNLCFERHRELQHDAGWVPCRLVFTHWRPILAKDRMSGCRRSTARDRRRERALRRCSAARCSKRRQAGVPPRRTLTHNHDRAAPPRAPAVYAGYSCTSQPHRQPAATATTKTRIIFGLPPYPADRVSTYEAVLAARRDSRDWSHALFSGDWGEVDATTLVLAVADKAMQ